MNNTNANLKNRIIITKINKSFNNINDNNIIYDSNNTDKLIKAHFESQGLKFQVGVDLVVNKVPKKQITHLLDYNEIEPSKIKYIYLGKGIGFRIGEHYFHVTSKVNPLLKKVHTNPNRFRSFQHYLDDLKQVLPDEYYYSLKPIRVDSDLVTNSITYYELNRRLYMKNTKSIEIYRLTSQELTRYFGKFPNVTTSYELQEKHGIDGLKLEERKFGNKVKIFHPEQIPDWFLNGDANYFKNAYLLNFDFKALDSRKRHIQFETISNILGTQCAKIYLNRSGNFKRDFQKILFAKKPLGLANVWQKSITAYFNQK